MSGWDVVGAGIYRAASWKERIAHKAGFVAQRVQSLVHVTPHGQSLLEEPMTPESDFLFSTDSTPFTS